MGAGPAGCVMAAALLDAGLARRRLLDVRVFGAGPTWGPDRPLVLDDPSITRLAALGIPLPAGRSLEGFAIVHGREKALHPCRLNVLRRNRLLGLLRSFLHARGAQVSEQEVSQIAPAPLGRFIVRVDGASHSFDWVVLACGAGSPLANAIDGHRPPPSATACLVNMRTAPPLPALAVRQPRGVAGDLFILPHRDDVWISLVQRTATTRDLALALFSQTDAAPPVLGPLTGLDSFFVPDGVSIPGLPSVGSALGGPISGSTLDEVSKQALQLASAFFEGGQREALASSRREARSLEEACKKMKRASNRIRRFSTETRERAMREERKRQGLPSPAHRALSGQENLTFPERIMALVALLLVALMMFWERLRRQEPSTRAPMGEEVFLLEDDVDQAVALSAYLRTKGFSCSAFSDVMQAASSAAKRRPAVIIVDLALPWIDGEEAVRLLRGAGLQDVPIVITSALFHLGEDIRKRLKAVSFFPKPLDLDELVRTLSHHVTPHPPQEGESLPRHEAEERARRQ